MVGSKVKVVKAIGALEALCLNKEFIVVKPRSKPHGFVVCTTPEFYVKGLPVEGRSRYLFHPEALEEVFFLDLDSSCGP